MKLFNIENLTNNPTCIDLILIRKNFFKNSKTFEVGTSDHHLLILTSMRGEHIKGNPKIKFHQNYKHLIYNLLIQN